MPKILITGGSSGLGHELVLELIHKNFEVFNVDLISSKFTHPLKYDLLGNLADNKFLDKLTNLIQIHNVEILILNAASMVKSKYSELYTPEIEKQIEINVIANLKLISSFLKIVNQSKNEKKYNLIIISSSASFMPTPNMALYGAIKSFLSNFAQNILLEQYLNNIVVQCFEISGMKTNFQITSGVANPDSRFLMEPRKVAHKIVNKLVHGNSGIYKIGVISHAIFFIKRVLPLNLYIKTMGYVFAKNR